ncbi:MAG: BTAD domain-containing putative transcriptional regulator [Pseudonocardia sp.]
MTAVGVLGPLLVEGPDGPVRIGSDRQRRLLVALAAHAGRVVGTDLLTELVWGVPPADPAGAVQTNVSRLRRVLPAAVRIETAPDGYRLVAERAALDTTVFADQVAAAATDADGRPERLARALELWRGHPFAELDHPALQPEAARLVELRAAAAEEHAAALLAVGRVGEAVAAAESMVVAEPLREGAVAVLVRALVAAGRHVEALAALARLRERLAEELGLDPSPQLRELEERVLRHELPAPVRRDAPAPTAPTGPRLPLSSFVGRESELAAVAELLGRRRVVTLCGPGGVGKTRLALHTAAHVADRYDDGVLVVELGDGGPADIGPAFAAALRLADDGRTGSGALTERVVDVLAVRRQLLVVDNCEHVADEAAGLVEAIAGGAPGVDLLLTSREPLRVDAEHVVPVAPLDPQAAAALLTDRLSGAAAAPEPELVPELCRRLDHLPLALELAAGRAAALGVRGLLDALETDGAFEVLRGGRRTAAARHRSLVDVVAWSYSLLDERRRVLFERLAVFAGPVERVAVAAVCGDSTALPDLVERSLVVRHPGSPDRFGMLETLRAFGRTRLARDPGATTLRSAHATWAVRLADEVGADRRGPGEAAAVHRVDAHLPDLRRAHAWLCEHGPVDELLRMSVLFGELAYVRGRIDLVRLVEAALVAAGVPGPGTVPASAHPLAARLAAVPATSGWQRGDLDAAEAWGRHAVALAAAAGDPTAACYGHEALSNTASFRGDHAAVLHHGGRARDLARATGDAEWEALALIDLAASAAYAGDPSAAGHEAALVAHAPQLRSPTGRAWLHYALGELRAERGDPDAAGFLRTAISEAEKVDSGFVAGVARHTLLTSAARDGDPTTSLPAFGPLLDHWHGYGAWTQLWIAVRALAGTLSRLGHHREVAVLLAAMAASARATRVYGADAARLDAVRTAARAALGDGFAAATAEGAALGDHGAIALARRLTRPHR